MFSPTASQMHVPTGFMPKTHAGGYPMYPQHQAMSPPSQPVFGYQNNGYQAQQSHPMQQNYGNVQTIHPMQVQQPAPQFTNQVAPEGYSFVSVNPNATGVPGAYAPPQLLPMFSVSSPPPASYGQSMYYSTSTSPQWSQTSNNNNNGPQNEDKGSLKTPSQKSGLIRSNSKSSTSFDGSELSEEKEAGTAKDGYGSDGNESRNQSASDGGESERSTSGSPQKNGLMNLDAFVNHSGLHNHYYQGMLQQQAQRNQMIAGCNARNQTYSVNFMMGMQDQQQCKLIHPSIRAEEPTLINFLRRQTCPNLHHYMTRLRDHRNAEMFRVPDKPKKTRPTSKERQEELFKTELCNAWINGQKCRFGKKCIFAHGTHEIRQPKRKIDRMRSTRFKSSTITKDVLTSLNRLTEENFAQVSTEIISRCVEELTDLNTCKLIVQAVYNKAVWEVQFQSLYSKFWHKLINIHHLKQYMKKQMRDFCLWEYASGNRSKAIGAMSWIGELVQKGLFDEEVAHKILGDMSFGDKCDAIKL
eukprot:UN28922